MFNTPNVFIPFVYGNGLEFILRKISVFISYDSIEDR